MEPYISSNTSNNSYCSTIYTKGWPIRFVSGFSCSASIIGSILIILSYLCFKRLRTRVREILVHLSVTDAGVATANLIGIVVYFDGFYNPKCYENGSVDFTVPSRPIQQLCKTQAFFALYFTLSSILWTISLAVYLYFILVHHGTRKAKLFLTFSYVFCYSMPLLLSLWAVLTGRLGYSPYNSAGWCSVILINPKTQHSDMFMGIIGYDMWIYLALVLVSVLYLAMRSFLREEFERTKDYVPREQFWKAVNVLEYKFLSIPVAFFLLRMWTCIINLFYVYNHVGKEIPKALIYLSGIGDSGQWMVNAVLFVLLTKQVRDAFLQLCGCRSTVQQKAVNTVKKEPTETTRLKAGSAQKSRVTSLITRYVPTQGDSITPEPLTT